LEFHFIHCQKNRNLHQNFAKAFVATADLPTLTWRLIMAAGCQRCGIAWLTQINVFFILKILLLKSRAACTS